MEIPLRDWEVWEQEDGTYLLCLRDDPSKGTDGMRVLHQFTAETLHEACREQHRLLGLDPYEPDGDDVAFSWDGMTREIFCLPVVVTGFRFDL